MDTRVLNHVNVARWPSSSDVRHDCLQKHSPLPCKADKEGRGPVKSILSVEVWTWDIVIGDSEGVSSQLRRPGRSRPAPRRRMSRWRSSVGGFGTDGRGEIEFLAGIPEECVGVENDKGGSDPEDDGDYGTSRAKMESPHCRTSENFQWVWSSFDINWPVALCACEE